MQNQTFSVIMQKKLKDERFLAVFDECRKNLFVQQDSFFNIVNSAEMDTFL